MLNRIFITGGAGFIGSRLARALSPSVEQITVFDNLHTQVHGEHASSPDFPENVEFFLGDVADGAHLNASVMKADPDTIFHLAAETGTGQSYDEPARYNSVNVMGTAHVIEAVRSLSRQDKPRRIVLAGSRAVYGEGAYLKDDKSVIVGPVRSAANLSAGVYAPVLSDGQKLRPCPTQEWLSHETASVYASTKLQQEYLLTQCAAEGDYEPALLRIQNVYGPGQSLKNPYTGVLSIFSSQILAGQTLNIYEDGNIVRDFVYVDDVVSALIAAGRSQKAYPDPINIGSGYPATILEAAKILLNALGAKDDGFEITGQFRPGDIRHAVADIDRARTLLNWAPEVSLETGLTELATWARQSYEAKGYV